MSTGSNGCGRCGAALDATGADLDDRGRPVCRACLDKAQLAEGEKRSTAAISGAATTAAVLTFASCAVGLYAAVPAVVVGAGALTAARTADRLAPGSVATWVYAAAGFAVIAGALRILGFAAMLFLAGH